MNIYELDNVIKSLKKENDPNMSSLLDFYLKQRKILVDKINDAIDKNIDEFISSGVSSAKWRQELNKEKKI